MTTYCPYYPEEMQESSSWLKKNPEHGFKHITEGNIRGFIDTYKHVVKIYVHFISIFSLHVLLEIITVFVNESLLMNSPSRKEMGCQPEAEAVCCTALYSSHLETIALTP